LCNRGAADGRERPSTSADTTAPGIIVLGLGNVLMGDDGVGVHVAHALERAPVPGVAVYDIGTAVWHVPDLLYPGAWLLAVDAVELGRPAGTVALLNGADVWSMRRHAGAHGIGLFEFLTSMAPDVQPGRAAVAGIQPAQVAPGLTLSAALSAALPQIVETVRTLLAAWRAEQASPAVGRTRTPLHTCHVYA
jgi:hydrogenase maturation protease